MAKGGQGSAVTSPGGPSLSQEIAGLKKTIDDKNKALTELKAKLEEVSQAAQAKLEDKTVSKSRPPEWAPSLTYWALCTIEFESHMYIQ